MLIQHRREIADRACAAIQNIRAVEIQHALQLSPAAAWVLATMEADRAGVSADETQFESHTERYPFFGQADLMHRLVAQIHERIGRDATLTEGGIIRLTALGRVRIRLALREVLF